MVLLRHDDGANDVGQKSGATHQCEDHPQDAHQCWINVKILGEASAYAAEFLFRHRTIQFLVVHFAFDLVWAQKYTEFHYPERGKMVFLRQKEFVIRSINLLIINNTIPKKFVMAHPPIANLD